jgi:hypothetical protein
MKSKASLKSHENQLCKSAVQAKLPLVLFPDSFQADDTLSLKEKQSRF